MASKMVVAGCSQHVGSYFSGPLSVTPTLLAFSDNRAAILSDLPLKTLQTPREVQPSSSQLNTMTYAEFIDSDSFLQEQLAWGPRYVLQTPAFLSTTCHQHRGDLGKTGPMEKITPYSMISTDC